MTKLPDNQVIIKLSTADMKKAVEQYLNDHVLQRPCTVVSLTVPTNVDHSFEIRFEKSYDPQIIEPPEHDQA